MSRTITALFNDRSEAEAAAAQLRTQIGAEARITDQSSGGSGSSESSSGSGGSIWSDLKDIFVADEDRSGYEEGVRRGHFMLSAIVPEDQADRACSLLDQAGAVDFDESQQKWRSEGWSGGSSSSMQQQTGGQSAAFSSSQSQGSGFTGETQRSNIVQEERIPIVEEQLRVGKREVERGGARVRSYVEEQPVSENVNLREEHVDVTRRPVDQPISAAELDNGLLQDRTIEMRETAEEAVVDKQARVTEEVLVQKTATERTEQVQDTLRRTDVEVDEDARSTDRGAFFDENREQTSTSREFDTDTNRR